MKKARGNWSVGRSGDIVFSGDFLKSSGEALRGDETASALNSKGPYLQIAVGTKSGEPTFRKKQFF